jgi:PEGA domain
VRSLQRQTALLGLTVACALSVLSSTAHAQTAETCVLLPHAAADVPAAIWERVDGAVSEALRGRGLIVLSARDAQLRMMGQPMEDCGAIECAPDVNRFLGTAFAVLTEVTMNRGRANAVNVVLIGLASDHASGGQASVARTSELEEATFAAFGVAWDRWEADRQGQLVVESTPEGAFVELDGASVGRAPIRRLVTTGVHTIRLTLEGYVTETREITIDRHEERTLTVTLSAAGGATAAGTVVRGGGTADATAGAEGAGAATVERAHWANWLIGGGLLAAAVGLAIQPIYALAVEGDAAPGGYYQVVASDWVLLGLSGACLIGGVVVLAVQPIRETVVIEPGLGFLRVRGTF